ncbi:hypothetical protein M758_12G147500 [Ceratodon purpureus]|nr:hypothetical protein M758_12G147500 [Ceratodon purpureus]
MYNYTNSYELLENAKLSIYSILSKLFPKTPIPRQISIRVICFLLSVPFEIKIHESTDCELKHGNVERSHNSFPGRKFTRIIIVDQFLKLQSAIESQQALQ